jgi:hypothetical protein
MIRTRWFDAEFNRMLTEIANESRRAEPVVLTDQARKLLMKLAWNTRRAPASVRVGAGGRTARGRFRRQIKKIAKYGRARAGWWPAWRALRLPGTPYVGNKRLEATNEGEFIDQRRGFGKLAIGLVNTVPYIELLDVMDRIKEKAMVGRSVDMDRMLERKYGRILRAHSRG